MDEAAIRQLKVAELKVELSKLNLPTTGKKDDLVARLLEALANLPLGANADGSRSGPASPRPPQPTSPVPKPSSPLPRLASRSPFQAPSTLVAGGDSEKSRRISRAMRFGSSEASSVVDERKKQRVERFGSMADDSAMDTERLKVRQARFGETTSERLVRAEEEAAKARRLARFGLNSN